MVPAAADPGKGEDGNFILDNTPPQAGSWLIGTGNGWLVAEHRLRPQEVAGVALRQLL